MASSTLEEALEEAGKESPGAETENFQRFQNFGHCLRLNFGASESSGKAFQPFIGSSTH